MIIHRPVLGRKQSIPAPCVAPYAAANDAKAKRPP